MQAKEVWSGVECFGWIWDRLMMAGAGVRAQNGSIGYDGEQGKDQVGVRGAREGEGECADFGVVFFLFPICFMFLRFF